jgi:hypothetical protein
LDQDIFPTFKLRQLGGMKESVRSFVLARRIKPCEQRVIAVDGFAWFDGKNAAHKKAREGIFFFLIQVVRVRLVRAFDEEDLRD